MVLANNVLACCETLPAGTILVPAETGKRTNEGNYIVCDSNAATETKSR